MAQQIIDGDYGQYAVADRWDAAFDWDNDNCDEVIFGFPADAGYTYWQYQGDTYWWTVPARARYYFNDSKSKATTTPNMLPRPVLPPTANRSSTSWA